MSKLKKYGFVLTAVMFIAVVGIFTACGGSSPVPAETNAAEEPAQTTEAAMEAQTTEAPAEEAVQPAGDCPSATSVSVESTNGAYAERMPINWNSLGTQAAYITNTYGNTSVFVYIANFETSENLKDAAIGDGQAIIYFSLRIRGEGDPVPIESGVYAMRDYDSNDLYVEPKIRLSGGSTLQISVHELNVEDFEVTSVTDTEICGNFSIDEKWTKMSGEFKVPIIQ